MVISFRCKHGSSFLLSNFKVLRGNLRKKKREKIKELGTSKRYWCKYILLCLYYVYFSNIVLCCVVFIVKLFTYLIYGVFVCLFF